MFITYEAGVMDVLGRNNLRAADFHPVGGGHQDLLQQGRLGLPPGERRRASRETWWWGWDGGGAVSATTAERGEAGAWHGGGCCSEVVVVVVVLVAVRRWVDCGDSVLERKGS
jgi:hypothetical protein